MKEVTVYRLHIGTEVFFGILIVSFLTSCYIAFAGLSDVKSAASVVGMHVLFGALIPLFAESIKNKFAIVGIAGLSACIGNAMVVWIFGTPSFFVLFALVAAGLGALAMDMFGKDNRGEIRDSTLSFFFASMIVCVWGLVVCLGSLIFTDAHFHFGWAISAGVCALLAIFFLASGCGGSSGSDIWIRWIGWIVPTTIVAYALSHMLLFCLSTFLLTIIAVSLSYKSERQLKKLMEIKL